MIFKVDLALIVSSPHPPSSPPSPPLLSSSSSSFLIRPLSPPPPPPSFSSSSSSLFLLRSRVHPSHCLYYLLCAGSYNPYTQPSRPNFPPRYPPAQREVYRPDTSSSHSSGSPQSLIIRALNPSFHQSSSLQDHRPPPRQRLGSLPIDLNSPSAEVSGRCEANADGVCTHAHIHTYTHTNAHIRAHPPTIHTHTHTHPHTCTHPPTHPHPPIPPPRTHTHTRTHIQVFLHGERSLKEFRK